jgi:hypothetical protein
MITKHAVSALNYIKLRPHFIYTALPMMIQFELYTLTDHASHVSHQNMWDIHAHAFKHGMDASHVSMVAMNTYLLPWIWGYLFQYVTCVVSLHCLWWYNSYLLDDLIMLVLIQIIYLRQTVIVMMNLWYCNCETNYSSTCLRFYSCDDEIIYEIVYVKLLVLILCLWYWMEPGCFGGLAWCQTPSRFSGWW